MTDAERIVETTAWNVVRRYESNMLLPSYIQTLREALISWEKERLANKAKDA